MSAPGGPQSLQRTAPPANADPRRGRKKAPNASKGTQGNQPSKNRQASGNASNQPNSRRNQQKQNDRSGKGQARNQPHKDKSRASAKQPQEPIVVDDMEEDGFVQPKRMTKLNADAIQQFSNQEINATGSIFPDPSSLGFMRGQQKKPRPIPRYMLNQPRLLSAPEFKQDPWDRENQEKMIAMEVANNGSDFQGIYEEFQRMREVERKKMEDLGLVDAENITKDLNDAIFFQGTCLDMCPSFERVRRSLENNVKALEKDPVTQKISRDRAVKAFSRPAAGQPPPMPSDVRPPHVLLKTLDYIINEALPLLPESHSFIWDRTRSIRQDFIYQNYYGPEAIDCNERIVRIHLLSLHIMAGSDVEYSQQQELEQFNKALQTLTEIYQDVRNHGGVSPNEAEFRAYHLLSHFRDPELEREIQTLPDEIYKDHNVQLALRFRTIMSQNNIVERGFNNTIGAANLFVDFFRLAYHEDTPLLLACLLETHFNEIRFYALKSLSRSYHTKGKAFSGESLRQMLGFDSMEKLVKFVTYYEVDTFEEDGQLLVDLCNKEKLESQYKLNSMRDKPKLAQAFSMQLEERRNRQSISSVVNSGRSNADLHLKHTATIVRPPHKAMSTSSQPAAKPPIAFGQTPGSTLENSSSFGSSANNKQPGPGPFNGTSSGFGMSNNSPANNVETAPQQTAFGFNNGQTASSGFGQPQSTKAPAFDFKAGQQNQASENNKPAPFSFAQPEKEDAAPARFGSAKQTQAGSITGNATPSFNFASPHGVPSKPVEPTFNFDTPGNASKPQTNFRSTSQNFTGIENKKESTKREKTPEEVHHAKDGEQKNMHTNFQFNSSAQNVAKTPLFFGNNTPAAPKTPAKLTDHHQFRKASESVADAIIKNCIDDELSKILSMMVTQQKKSQERSRIIDSLADELFSAFLSEVTHQTLLKGVAKATYEKSLKKKAFTHLRSASEKIKADKKLKKFRMEELQSASFKVPSLKRHHSPESSNSSFAKKHRVPRNQADMSYDDIHNRREEIQKLWEPLDLLSLTKACSGQPESLTGEKPLELKCLLIVENWASAYSKWLNTKFSLKISDDKTHYENVVLADDLKLRFQSLPKANSIDQKSFQNTAFVIFECGLHEEQQVSAYKNLEVKLNRDRGILEKIIKICDRFCLYQYQVVLLVWDITNSGMPSKEILHRLSVGDDKSMRNVVLCDMSRSDDNVADKLERSMQKLAANFTGELSNRGRAKKLKYLQKQKAESLERDSNQATEKSHASEQILKAKEEAVLRRAKELQKRRYLSEHVVGNQSVDLSNQSIAYRTPNGSFNNTTNVNNSFMGNNSFLNVKDTSFLKSFGNASFLEESTPWGSPRQSFSKPALPKKVEELKSLTASIRARYKK